jgi:hypothetical protein
MAQNKKRPQYIEKQLKEINDVLRNIRMKYDDRYSNDLFSWFTTYLLHNGWYRGFNMHYDQKVTYSDGTTKVIRALAGPGYENKDYYIQIW